MRNGVIVQCSKCCDAAPPAEEAQMIVQVQEYVAERGELLRGQVR